MILRGCLPRNERHTGGQSASKFCSNHELLRQNDGGKKNADGVKAKQGLDLP